MTRPGLTGPGLIPRPVAVAIALVISAGWGLNLIADIFVEGYESNATVNTTFMVVVGVIFALGRGKAEEPPADQPPDPPAAPDPPARRDRPAGSMTLSELLAEIARRDAGGS